MKSLLILLAGWNLITFLVTGFDKMIAGSQARRVPERTLLLMSALFGAAGVYAAMQLLRHKTKHKKFVYGVPLLLIVNLLAGFYLASRLN